MSGRGESQESWTIGQRWVSDGEPELGLGIVKSSGDGRVEIRFPAAGETRVYATDTAPLRRVEFLPGDRIRSRDGSETTVRQVLHAEGRFTYLTDEGDVPETQLSDSISFSRPQDRLFGGKLDEPAEFELRREAWFRRAEFRRSPVRGLTGARMDLIPHQLFIADEVAARPRPRVLLADQVGLGKTIEACLIVHRLILTGRASRVLILLPEPLVHQWFVELLRRFQLSFSLFDEERCVAIETGEPGCNPFLDSQWVLAPIDFLAYDDDRAAQAIAAGWDLLVVDEAHHLQSQRDKGGSAYDLVKGLSATTPGLLLLTATPQQLGPQGHFARLQLLDPQRHSDPERFHEETLHYEKVADLVEALHSGTTPDASTLSLIAGHQDLEKTAADLMRGDESARLRLIRGLLDGFGMGRVMFRNTRERLGGFPKRERHLIPVEDKNPWLHQFLKNTGTEKILVITRSRESAEELLADLREHTGVNAALFHEDLSLLQRDRNAAYFAEEDGARVLLCSEIGSEGRNFQFAHHLVLYDLPDDVDLLEQRIGRLDRIGRRGTIHIHVPYLQDSAEEIHVRWLDEGLDAFHASPPGAAEIQAEVAADLTAAFANPALAAPLIAHTLACRQKIAQRLAHGQDRLLERTSHDPARASALVSQIRAWDESPRFEDFVLRLFEHAGLHIEDLGQRRYFLLPGNLKSDAFPTLPADGMTVTLDRHRALEREQEAFLTMDHPMVRAAFDLLLGSEAGNASFAIWDTPGSTTKTLLLEAVLIVECIAPSHLQIERFLPPTPLVVAVDPSGVLAADSGLSRAPLRRGDPGRLLRNPLVRHQLLPQMLNHARAEAERQSTPRIEAAHSEMQEQTSGEIHRLRTLASVNDHVHPEEILLLEAQRDQLSRALRAARLRLDSVRLIWKAPPA